MTFSARSLPDTPLVSASAPLPPSVDPVRLLAAYPRAARIYLSEPARQLTIAAVGVAVALEAAGPRRLSTLDALRRATPLPPDALWLGGWAFSDAAPGGAWRGFPSALLHAPRLAAIRTGSEGRLVALAARPASATAMLAEGRAALEACPPHASPRPRAWSLRAASPPDTWERRVARTLEDIAAGRLAKLVLARAVHLAADAPFDPLRTLERLEAAPAEATIFAIGRGDLTFLGATPERLVRVQGDRLETVALAGTTRRTGLPALDARLGDTLRASAKERAEHAFVVDDVRRRLAPLTTHIEAPLAPELVGVGDLQHLRTPFVATLRAGRTLLEAAAALHPTPAVCGLPQPAALTVLRRRERLARGWYTGGIGWLDARGDGEFVVPLRCALVRGRSATLFAGAGIVAGSDPARELEETRLKLRPLLAALLEW